MENNQDFLQTPEMIAMLEQLKRDIIADIEKRKYAYIGKDGREYSTIEELDAANKIYIENMYKFIGKDGREYSTTEELDAANQRYAETMFPKIEKIDNIYYNDSEISHKKR